MSPIKPFVSLLLACECPAGHRATSLCRLRGRGLPLRFVSNTTKESGVDLHRKLTTLGFDVQREEMFTSLSAASQLVRARALKPMLLLEPSAATEFDPVEGPLNAVVVGLAPSQFHFSRLNEAFRLLLDGAPLIAIHKGRYYETAKGLSLGPGPFVCALEYASGTQAEVVGKPTPAFFRAALDSMSVSDPADAVMIGDDVRDDVHGAEEAGIRGILVKTGKYRPGDENKGRTTLVCENFAQAVDAVLH